MTETRRVVRVDFNQLWWHDGRNGVTANVRSNPDLAVGDRVTVYDWYVPAMAFTATVDRIENGRVFLACDWEHA